MGPIYGFMLLAVLIGGSAIATDKANGAELPEEVTLIHSEIHSYTVEKDLFKEYLRHSGYSDQLPSSINYRLDCYSDGSGRVLKINGITDIHRTLTAEGRGLLRATLLNVAYYSCSMIWEARYESGIDRESNDAWYF